MSLVELAADNDRPAVADAIELLRNGDVTRGEGEISDLPEVPVRLFLARVPNTATGEPVLLVQGSDIAARRRVEALRDCTAAVREVLVTSAGADQAMPLVLRAFCERLGWSAAQHWVVDEERKSMRVRHSWNASGAALEGCLHASRGVVAAEGSGLRGRVWQAGGRLACTRRGSWPASPTAAPSRSAPRPAPAGGCGCSSPPPRSPTRAEPPSTCS